jgi:hypothetical protein
MFLAPVSGAEATVMQYLSETDLAQRSLVIVRGVVAEQTAVRFNREIWTDVRVRIEKLVRGQVQGDEVLVRQPGGVLGGLGMKVVGAARFRSGERVLLFLQPIAGGFFCVGLAQGKYDVFRDAKGAVRVRRSMEGVALLTPWGTVDHPPAEPTPLLADFEARVSAIVRSVEGGGR